MSRLRVQTGDIEDSPITNVRITRVSYVEDRRLMNTSSESDGADTNFKGGSTVRVFNVRGYVIDGAPNIINKQAELTGTLELDSPYNQKVSVICGRVRVGPFNFEDGGSEPPFSARLFVNDAMTEPAR